MSPLRTLIGFNFIEKISHLQERNIYPYNMPSNISYTISNSIKKILQNSVTKYRSPFLLLKHFLPNRREMSKDFISRFPP